MAELFGKAKSTINEHIKNVFAENELTEDHVMRKFGNSEFSTKPTNYYNLDVIISVDQQQLFMDYDGNCKRGVFAHFSYNYLA